MAAKRFPMRLKQLREAKGWSQAKLVDEAGVSREYIARLETGKHDPPLSRSDRETAEVTDLVRGQLKRDCSNALRVVQQDRVDGLEIVGHFACRARPAVSRPRDADARRGDRTEEGHG